MFSSFAELLNERRVEIDGWTTLGFKYNIDGDVANNNETIFRNNQAILDYCKKFTKYQHADGAIWEGRSPLQFMVSAGIHVEGRNEIPHCHVQVGVLNWTKSSLESRRRKKEGLDIEGLSCRIDVANNVDEMEAHLMYPFKENQIAWVVDGMLEEGLPVEMKFLNICENERICHYMSEKAVALWDIKKARDRAKKRAVDKQRTVMENVLQLYKKRKTQFSCYSTYKQYIYEAYYDSLEIEDYPCYNELMKAVRNVAIHQKVVPPYYFDTA